MSTAAPPTMVGTVEATVASGPDRLLLAGPDDPASTYGEVWTSAGRIANALRAAGVRRGDRVAAQVEKSAAVVGLYLGCLRAGAVYLPMSMAYTPDEVGYLLGDAEPALFVRDPGLATVDTSVPTFDFGEEGEGPLRDLAATQPGDVDGPTSTAEEPAALLYTSGTTGRPKGAPLSQGGLAASALALRRSWGFTAADVLVHALPMHHAHGLFISMGCTLASGSAMTFLRRFDPAGAIAAFDDGTVFMGVPTHYVRLLADDALDRERTASMRLFVSGSAPLLPRTHEAFAARTGHHILERYGATETMVMTSNPLDGERRAGSVGLALPGVDVRIGEPSPGVEPGEHGTGDVEVSGASVFAGYWRRPDLQHETFTSDGWYRTGDVGRLDRDGYLHLVGRSKDLIISGGLNVYPKEVEDAIDALPGVDESAVIGLPDADYGEAVVAVVVAEPGTALDGEAIRRDVRARLAGFKVPKQVLVVEALPRNVMGKVEKQRLRDQLGGGSPA